MTIKQCNSCKYHILVKELRESCFFLKNNFMKGKNCELYLNGKINQGHKEFFARNGREYPFTEIR